MTSPGIEPGFTPWEGVVLTAWPRGRILFLIWHIPSKPHIEFHPFFFVFAVIHRSSTYFITLASPMFRPIHSSPYGSKLPTAFPVLSEPLPKPYWISPRPISDSQLHVLPHFHLCPIYLVVFKGSYYLRMGYLISVSYTHLTLPTTERV